MSQTIREMYSKSIKMKNKEKTDYLEKLLSISEDAENNIYQYQIKFDLIDEYKKAGKLLRSIHLYNQNIHTYLENNFDCTKLIYYFPWISRHIDAVLGIEQQDINAYFSNMKKVFGKNSFTLRSFYQEYYGYLMRAGKWEEGLTVYTDWMIESRDCSSESIGKEEAERAYYYFNVGDYQNGKYVFETITKGLESPPGTRTFAYPRAAKYFLELKEWEMVSLLVQRGYQFSRYRLEYIEEIAEILKVLVILNPKIALKVWKKHRYFFKQVDNHRAKFSYGISSYLLERSLSIEHKEIRKIIKLKENIKEMYEIQNLMDRRNGTNYYHEELEYWIEIWERFNKKEQE